jgi:hypothetical protein
MRLAGVPARVVAGYLGGEFNAYGGFFIVRQADAHAWCEVWLPDVGWQRVDVTGVVAPDRVNLGFQSFLERRAASGEERLPISQTALSGRMKRWPLVNDVSLAWDSLNYAWDTRVLGFDAEEQQQLFSAMNLSDTTPIALLIRLAMIALALVALYALWMQMEHARARRPGARTLRALLCQGCQRRRKAITGRGTARFLGPRRATLARRVAAHRANYRRLHRAALLGSAGGCAPRSARG